jgi:hypothetical protein
MGIAFRPMPGRELARGDVKHQGQNYPVGENHHYQLRRFGVEKSLGGDDGCVETRAVPLFDKIGVEELACDHSQPWNAVRLGENQQRRGDEGSSVNSEIGEK